MVIIMKEIGKMENNMEKDFTPEETDKPKKVLGRLRPPLAVVQIYYIHSLLKDNFTIYFGQICFVCFHTLQQLQLNKYKLNI